MPHLVIQFSTSAPASFVPFSKGWPNRWSKAIRVLGHSYFSHVDFCVSVELMARWLERDPVQLAAKYGSYGMLGASYNPNAPVIAGNPGGVAYRPIDYQSFGIRRWMIFDIEQAMLEAILFYAHSQVGRPFDSAALSPKIFLSDPFYGAVESRDWRDPNKWFCQELVVCSLETGGFWGVGVKCPILKNRITPADGTMILMMDHRLLNRDTWLAPISGISMGRYEM